MKIAVGFDHGGFPLKQIMLETVIEVRVTSRLIWARIAPSRWTFRTLLKKLAARFRTGKAERGILVCGSGVGACIAANKMKGVYASICHDTYSAATRRKAR